MPEVILAKKAAASDIGLIFNGFRKRGSGKRCATLVLAGVRLGAGYWFCSV